MITTENTYFLKIILLLYDAASFILRQVIVRELKKQGDDIDNLLKRDEFENKLKHKLHFGKSQVEKLFPSNGKSDIQTWDSQMLAVVSLLIFRSTLSSDEKYHIKFIKLTRNSVAHKPSASYFEDDFVDEKEGIIKAITILASGFDSTVQEKCGELISSYCSDPLDTHVQLAIKHLEDDTTNSELLRQILDALNNKHEIVLKDIQDHAEKIENKIHLTEKKICESQETVLKGLNGLCLDIGNVESKVTESKEKSSQELKQVNASLTNHIINEAGKVSQKVDLNNSLLQEVQRNQNEHAAKLESKLEELKQLFEQTSRTGGHCTKQIKFGTHTHLTVDGPTQEWINTVETVLKSVFDILLNNVQEPEQNLETERAVKEFLNYIKGFKGVELKSVERKCIILAFECLTYDSLRELIEFINSNGFLSYLESIARALEKDLKIPQKLVISSEIPVTSLQLVFDDKSSNIILESKKGIALSFECTSIDGLDAFWRLFVKGEATPYIDNISATISSGLGEKTSLSTSVNLQEFEDALTNLEATVNKEKETKPLKPNRETTRQSSDLPSDLELDIDTIQTRKDVSPGDLGENSQSLRTRKQSNKHHTYITDSDAANNYSFRGFSPRWSPIFKKHELQPEIKSAGAQYDEIHLINLTQTAPISFSHQQYKMSLVYKKDINLPHDSDEYNVVSLCAVLSNGRILILREKTFTRVYNLKVVNIHTGFVEQWQSLHSRPSDIAALPNDQVAVTLPSDNVIAILSTNEKSVNLSIPVEKRPSGITYHQDELYVVCEQFDNRPIVNVFKIQGDFVRKIDLDIEQLSTLNLKIAVSTDLQRLYVADYWSGSLISFSSHGKVTARYRFGMLCPKGLTILDDGTLLFFSENAYPIRHISADLQQDYVLEMDVDIGYIFHIGFDRVNKHIYVCSRYDIYVYCLVEQSSILLKDETNFTFLRDEDKSSSFKTVGKVSSLKTDGKLSSLKTEDKLGSLKTEDNLSSLTTKDKLSSLKTEYKLSSVKTEYKLGSLKTEDNLSSLTTKDKLSSLKTEYKLSSVKTEYKLSSVKTEDKLSYLKNEAKLSSLKAEDKLSSLKTEDKLSSLKAEDNLSSLKTEGKLGSFKTEDKLSPPKTENKLSSLKTEERLGSLKTEDKLRSVDTKGNKVKERSSSKSDKKSINYGELIYNSQFCELS